MDFSNRLNSYISDIGCTAKELADASGLSAAAISRYRTGERAPDPDGENLRSLAEGIAHLSPTPLSASEVHNDLAVSISGITVDYDTFLLNLSALLEATSISNNDLARALNFDPSYISRILGGQRRPADIQSFVHGVATHTARKAQLSQAAAVATANLLGLDKIPESNEMLVETLSTWLRTHYLPMSNPIDGFLEKLDSFELDDFIRSIHFDEMNPPTLPLQLPTRKTYTGLRNMMACEIDFLKAVVLSKSSADVIMYSDMPMTKMAADLEFSKKWMLGMAMILKKGLHVNIIHRVDRPLHEMMIGLESYIPMYMTGQISPYYFPHDRDEVFSQLLRVSGTAAQVGEAIVGHHADGRYLMTTHRDEVRYYRRRAEQMLEKAKPLMRILANTNPADMKQLSEIEAAELEKPSGTWRIIMSTVPIGAMPESVLDAMITRHNLTSGERDAVEQYARRQTALLDAALEHGSVTIEVPDLGEAEFAEHPMTLCLCCMPFEKELSYTYEEYRLHLEHLIAKFAEYPKSTCKLDRRSPFRNTQIRIRKGKYAVVSKCKNPSIHFVIEHPKLVRALERFSAPVIE